MIDFCEALLARLPPLGHRRNANLAALLGFLFGPLGLAIYLMSAVELCIGVLLYLMCVIVFGLDDNEDVVLLLPSAIAGLWGYFRVLESNERLTVVGGQTPADRSVGRIGPVGPMGPVVPSRTSGPPVDDPGADAGRWWISQPGPSIGGPSPTATSGVTPLSGSPDVEWWTTTGPDAAVTSGSGEPDEGAEWWRSTP